jgi:hypothetical protein
MRGIFGEKHHISAGSLVPKGYLGCDRNAINCPLLLYKLRE